MSKKPEKLGDQSHFMYHLGLAISTWQNVERELGHIFCIVMAPSDQAADAAYHSILGLEVRVDMVHATIHAVIGDKALRERWDELYIQINKKRKKRNRLVHFQPIMDSTPPTGPGFIMVPKAPGDFLASLEGKGPKYDWTHIQKFGQDFMDLYIRLTHFGRDLQKWRTRPPASP